MKKSSKLLTLAIALILSSCSIGNINPANSSFFSEVVESNTIISSDSSSVSSQTSYAPHDHEYEFHEEKTASCKEEGNEAYYTCSICSQAFDSNKNPLDNAPIIAKLEHNYSEHYGLFAAASKTGLTTYYSCDLCRQYFNANKEEITAPNSDENRIEAVKGSTDPVLVIGKDFEMTYNDALDATIRDLMGTLKLEIEKGELPYTEISNSKSKLSSYYSTVNSDYIKYFIAQSMYNDYRLITQKCNQLLSELSNFFYAYETLIGKSVYRYDYFEGKTDEEIDKYLSKYNVDENDAITKLQIAMDQIQTEYQMDEEHNVGDYFKRYKEKANELASYYGCSSYLEYAYIAEYGRSYTIEDTEKMFDYLKDYIVPSFDYLLPLYRDTYYSLTTSEQEELANLNSSFVSQFSLLNKYAKAIGNTYEENFNNLWSSGNYYLSDIENPNITAFQWSFANGKQFLFFSKDYQSTSTFIHEFGHYNASFTSSTWSYDLLETQSQGNEMLFYKYLYNTANDISENVKKVFLYEQLLQMLNSSIFSYLCNYVENKAYSYEGNINNAILQGFWNEAAEKLDFTRALGSSYWSYALMQSPGYYISYSTSAIASLGIYALADDNFAKAKRAYQIIYDSPTDKTDFEDVLEEAGLSSVFEEEIYKEILEAISNCK